MAVTKIWPVKDSVARVVGYARNPEKTEFADVQRVLHYAGNGDKTVAGEERTMYVTGVNCRAETAAQEMAAVQERFGKTGGNVAYHAYQSFKTGEVTPALAHQIGVELARKMWGDQCQVLVATHFNTGTYHHHFVVNAVGMWNGKKFDCNKGAYWRFRSLSDDLCVEHGLTVIRNPKGKTPRKLYFAEKNGEPTRYNLMREAIDRALTMSTTEKMFCHVMRKLGYIVDLNPYHKYATIRSVNSKKATRLYRLGEAYDRPALLDRIFENMDDPTYKASRLYREFVDGKRPMVTVQRRRVRMKGSFGAVRKITGLRALYFRYCYLLGILPKGNQRRPLSPEMREECRRLDRYSRQAQLVARHDLRDLSDVERFMERSRAESRLLTDYRKTLYRQIASCRTPAEKETLISKRNDCTAALAVLRKELKTAQGLLDDTPKIRENIRLEERMRQEVYPPNKQKRREYQR